jgi:hypothetical protein
VSTVLRQQRTALLARRCATSKDDAGEQKQLHRQAAGPLAAELAGVRRCPSGGGSCAGGCSGCSGGGGQEVKRAAGCTGGCSGAAGHEVKRMCAGCRATAATEQVKPGSEHPATMREPNGVVVSRCGGKDCEGGCARRTCAGCAADQADGRQAVADRISAGQGHGRALDETARRYFEPRFGTALDGVRVHTDGAASELADGLDARAFTVQQDIYFAAGQYDPDSPHGRRLLAHELTHTLQPAPRPGTPREALRVSSPADPDERQADRVADGVVGGRLQPAHELARSARGGTDLPTVRRVGTDDNDPPVPAPVGSPVATVPAAPPPTAPPPTAPAATAGASTGPVPSPPAASSTVAGPATAAGAPTTTAAPVPTTPAVADRPLGAGALPLGGDLLSSFTALATLYGGSIEVTTSGVVITVPELVLCPLYRTTLPLPQLSKDIPFLAGGISAGPVILTGTLGLHFDLMPSLAVALGGCRLTGVRIVLDPLGGRYAATGTLSVGAALSELNMVHGALAGTVKATVIVPVGGVPIPLSFKVAELRGGAQLAARVTGGGTLSVGMSLTYVGGRLTAGLLPALALGGAIDLDLGLYGSLNVLGKDLCTLVWPLWHWQAEAARQWSVAIGAATGSGLSLGGVTSTPIPFDDAVRGIDRSVPAATCGLIDSICDMLRHYKLLPRDYGVIWTGHPPPKPPTPCNTHPDAPFQENPHIASGALCRGTCGVDCASNCVKEPDMVRCTLLPSGMEHQICLYRGVQNCGTHEGCRNHDHCYDWCAEHGYPDIWDTCHRWCDMGCVCEHDVISCIGWALGRPPFDSRLRYYDEAISVVAGPFPGPCVAGGHALVRVQQYLDLGDPEEIVAMLARAPIEERQYLAGDPWAVDLLQSKIGPILWPTARRILDGAASIAVPSLDEATWFLADLAIRRGDNGQALLVVAQRLRATGQIDDRLATWAYVRRSDRGEALTTFRLNPDPADPSRRRSLEPAEIEIYDPAFRDVGWLWSSMLHEYVHALQAGAGFGPGEFDPATGRLTAAVRDRNEVEAYLWEIEHSVGSGVVNNAGQMADLGRRLTSHYRVLPPEMQRQYGPRYDAALTRVADVVAGRRPLSIDEARKILAETSAQIAELLRNRPADPAGTDRRIEEIRRRRAAAMVTVAMVENPAIQVVQGGDPGIYRVPTVDADGRVRYLHGGIQVAWHLAAASTSAYTLGGALSAGGEMAVAGTAIQGRVHPFPPDVDFDETIHVVANTLADVGRIAAGQIIANIRRVHGRRIPGRSDVEFRALLVFPASISGPVSLDDVLTGRAQGKLSRAIANRRMRNMNSFWRGYLADGRFIALTKVIFVTANRPDGSVLRANTGSPDLNLAFLEEPSEIPTSDIGKFAWAMCCAAVEQAYGKADRRGGGRRGGGNWLKAAKRAYNYFSTIGDTAHMTALEPVFRTPEAHVEQYASVVDGIEIVLSPEDLGVNEPKTRILTVAEARRQIAIVADVVRRELPAVGGSTGRSPSQIADDLLTHASAIRARPFNLRDQVAQDGPLADAFGLDAKDIRKLLNLSLQSRVKPVIDSAVLPYCSNPATCTK